MVMKDKLRKHHRSYFAYKAKKISVFSGLVCSILAIVVIPSTIAINHSVSNSYADATKEDNNQENNDEQNQEVLTYQN